MMLLRIGVQGVPRGAVDEKRPARAAQAIRYAVDNGARVINWSGFVDETRPGKLKPLQEAVTYAESKGVLLVVAAGNNGVDSDKDENCTFPQCFPNENILSVAEVDYSGELYKYNVGDRVLGSNFGVHRVHIAAVGDNFTTSVQDHYAVYRVAGGTSNTAPVVTGVAALVLSVRPELKAPELKRLLISTATKLSSLDGKVASGGIVNAYNAVRAAKAK